MFKYAQIDKDGLCVGVSYLSGEVTADDMIALDEQTEPLGMKYTDGQWVEVPPQPQPTPEPTEQDLLNAELLLNQMEIIERQKAQDEVQAEILLNTLGV